MTEKEAVRRSYNTIYMQKQCCFSSKKIWVEIAVPHYLSILIEEKEDQKRLMVNSRFHVNKDLHGSKYQQVGPCFSLEFTDLDLLKELGATIYRSYIGG